MEDWKIKIALLWLVLECGILTISAVGSAIPGFTEEPPETVLAIVVSSMIPPIMAFLSLTLKNSINRWVNIILGIVFIVLMPLGTGFEVIPAAYLPSIIVIAIVEVGALALIVWYAWKSKQKA